MWLDRPVFALWPLTQNALEISFAVKDSDNLERRCAWPVYHGEIGIASERPKTKRSIRKVRPRVTTQRSIGDKFAGVVNGLFHAVGGVFAVDAM